MKATGMKMFAILAMLAALVGTSRGATHNGTVIPEIAPIRFQVVDVTKEGPPANGKQITVLRLVPLIHKSRDLAEARSKYETPALRIVVVVDVGYEIHTNDWFNLQAVRLPEPGSVR